MKIQELRILELASVLAGPSVGTFFAELGATVIKVENPNGGDITRNWRLPNESPHNSISAYYAAANTAKQVLSLNYTIEEDRKTLEKEIQSADIVIVNFKPGDAEKFNLTFEACKELNSALIYAEITGYGPESTRSAFDMVLQAETGYLSMNGSKSQPAKLPVAFIDLFAAHQLKEGILVALLQGNKGCKVSVSLYDAALASLANQATNQLMNDFTPKRLGTLHPNIAPYGEVLTFSDDVSIVLAIGNNKQFNGLLNILNLDEKEQFKTNLKRVKYRVELLAYLNGAAKGFSGNEFYESCMNAKVPVGKINNLKEVFEEAEAQNLVIEETIEGQLLKKVRTTVFTISS